MSEEEQIAGVIVQDAGGDEVAGVIIHEVGGYDELAEAQLDQVAGGHTMNGTITVGNPD